MPIDQVQSQVPNQGKEAMPPKRCFQERNEVEDAAIIDPASTKSPRLARLQYTSVGY
jgi:hypothetical protein